MMKKETIVTAKTIEDALEKARVELGAPSVDRLEYTVLEEPKKGLFGIGAVAAKVQASFRKTGAEVAMDFVRELIADMELDLNVTIADSEESKEDKIISIDGEGAGVLIGHHGDTLDALQYLVNLAANKKVDGEKREYMRITLNVEGYREKREETLRQLARRMAEKVLKYKKSVMLEPMNPYERRIIHSEVQKIEGVSTNSIGSENNRKIVMYLDEQGAAAAAAKGAGSIPAEGEHTERAASASKPRRRRRPSHGSKPAAPEKKNAPIDDTFTDPFLIPDLTGASEEYDREEAARQKEESASSEEPRAIADSKDL